MSAELNDGRHLTPEQTALLAILAVKERLEKTGTIDINNIEPESRLILELRHDRIIVSLLEGIGLVENDPSNPRSYSCLNATLFCFLTLNPLGSSIIRTEAKDPARGPKYSADIEYRPGTPKIKCGFSCLPSFAKLSPSGALFFKNLPKFDDLPCYIDFPKATTEICAIALGIIEDRQLTPERIAKFREIVYVVPPEGQK